MSGARAHGTGLRTRGRCRDRRHWDVSTLPSRAKRRRQSDIRKILQGRVIGDVSTLQVRRRRHAVNSSAIGAEARRRRALSRWTSRGGVARRCSLRGGGSRSLSSSRVPTTPALSALSINKRSGHHDRSDLARVGHDNCDRQRGFCQGGRYGRRSRSARFEGAKRSGEPEPSKARRRGDVLAVFVGAGVTSACGGAEGRAAGEAPVAKSTPGGCREDWYCRSREFVDERRRTAVDIGRRSEDMGATALGSAPLATSRRVRPRRAFGRVPEETVFTTARSIST